MFNTKFIFLLNAFCCCRCCCCYTIQACLTKYCMSARSRTFAHLRCVYLCVCHVSSVRKCVCLLFRLSFFAVWLFFYFVPYSFIRCSCACMCVRECVCVFNYCICGSFSYDSSRNCCGACGSYMNYMYTERRQRRRRQRPSVYLNIIVCLFIRAMRDSGRKAKDIRLTKKFSPQCVCPHHIIQYTKHTLA